MILHVFYINVTVLISIEMSTLTKATAPAVVMHG